MKIQLNKVCFGLPIKSFFMDYTVSKKRELPVVKEFVIRLIYSLSSTTLETIQGYFGFSSKEMLSIIEDLQEENLVIWDDGEIKLSFYAMSKFKEEDGALRPTFFEVTDESSTVELELLNFRILPSDVKRSGSQDFSISLKLPDGCYSNLLNKAQNAFDTNFNLFREIVLGEDVFSVVKELYKINHVSDRYDATLPLDVEYYIDTDSPQKLKMAYVSNTVDEWDEEKSFFSLMDSTIGIGAVNDQSANFTSYLDASKDPLLLQYWSEASKSINLDALVSHYENGLTKLNDDTFMLLGNFYTETNKEIIHNKLKSLFQSKLDNSGLVWLTNSDSITWGKTSDLNKLIDGIYNLFDKRKKTSKVVLGMACESFQESIALKNNFWKVSNAELLDLPNKFGGEDAEFLIIPNIMVASLFHFKFDDDRNISLPIGYISFEPEVVSEVSKELLEWSVLQPKYNDFFEKKGTKQEHTIKNKYFMPILQQSIE